MTRFKDGPAQDTVLQLARAPLFLRVTQNAAGKFDALDQLDDHPRANESVTVYRKVSDDGTVHVDFRDERGRRRGAWYACATYALATMQPDDATARDTTLWRQWCLDHQRQAAQDAPGSTPTGEDTP